MNVISSSPSIDSTLNLIEANSIFGSREDNKIISESLKSNKQKVKDQRQEKIQNLKDQLKGVSQGKCFKVIKTVFKVVDLLAKPLSLITANQLNLKLSKTLDIIGEAKKQNKLMGLKIDYQQIAQVIEGIKKVITQDHDQIESNMNHTQTETHRILQILDEIDASMQATQTK